MSANELSRKVKKLRRLRMEQDALAAEIESITDEIKQAMQEQEADELAGADFKITWKAVTTSRFDSRAFKAAMPELYNRFTSSTTTRRFLVV